jgi:hypothetical protein
MFRPMVPRLGRAFARGAIPIAVSALAMFAVYAVLVLPPRSGAIDVAKAKRIVAAQWIVPVIAIHLMFVLPAVIAPWIGERRGARRDGWMAIARLPVVWIYALIAQAMVGLGMFAGIVPGVLALAPAALVAVAVAHGARGMDAIRIAGARAARRRAVVIAVVVIAIAAEIALTVVAREALVPKLEKKAPLAGVVLFAWVNAARAAITTPMFATVIAMLYGDSGTAQAESAARTPAASEAETTA